MYKITKLYYSKRIRFVTTTLIICCVYFTTEQFSFSQPTGVTYADAQTNGGGGGFLAVGSYSVATPNNAIKSVTNVKPNENSALLTATSTAGVYSAWIQLSFSSTITATALAPVTVYIRTNENTSALLGGGVTIQAYNASGTAVTTPAYRYYYLVDGTILMSVVLESNFIATRVTLTSPAALGTNTLNVYHAFYSTGSTNTSNPYPFNASDCGYPNVASKEVSGNFNITNPTRAFDSDATFSTKSTFVATGLNILSGYVKQTFFFNGLSNSGDAVRLVISRSGSLLAVNLASSVTLQAYNGGSSVGSLAIINDLLDVDLLNLLKTNDTPLTVYFAPKNGSTSVLFDRVEVKLDIGLLGVSLDNGTFHIHDVRRTSDAPASSGITVCRNIGTGTLSALSSQESITGLGPSKFVYRWYTTPHGESPVFTGKSFPVSGLSTPGEVTYYVDTEKDNCAVKSVRKSTKVTVLNVPSVPLIGLTP